jgi:isoquinoline 1-oxidoreductase beta subunit
MGYQSTSRRFFLKAGSAAGGGLTLSFTLPGLSDAKTKAVPASPVPAPEFVPNAFLRIDPQGQIIFISPHTEFGQGIYTSTAMLMAEELDVGLDQIQIEAAPPDLKQYADPNLGDQATGGSTSTRSDWLRLRQAAATGRFMMVFVAAQKWQVDPTTCTVVRGVVHHPTKAATLSYGELAGAAARLTVPQGIALKDPTKFTLIGTAAARLDMPAKVNGSAVFGIDVKLPGMLVGTLAISPVQGGKVAHYDVAAARAVPDVRDVIVTPDKALSR